MVQSRKSGASLKSTKERKTSSEGRYVVLGKSRPDDGACVGYGRLQGGVGVELLPNVGFDENVPTIEQLP